MSKRNWLTVWLRQAMILHLNTRGTDVVMAYCLPKDNVLGDIRIYLNGKLKQTICNRNLYWKNGEKAILTIDKVCADKDTLRLSCSGQYEGKRIPFEAWYTINQK